jgi:hypothetical protein
MMDKINPVCATGVAIMTRSAPVTASASDAAMVSTMPNSFARFNASTLRSTPAISRTACACFKPSANDPPIKPVPMRATLFNMIALCQYLRQRSDEFRILFRQADGDA